MLPNYFLLFSLSIIQFRSLEVMRTSFPNPHPVSLDIEIDMLDLHHHCAQIISNSLDVIIVKLYIKYTDNKTNNQQ